MVRKVSMRTMVLTSVCATVLAGSAVVGAGASHAEPTDTPEASTPATAQLPARLVSLTKVSPLESMAEVYSGAMGKNIQLNILRPAAADTPAPILYLLNGAGGGEDSATWRAKTDYQKFFADKHVNVVTPIGGAFSYYTDWQRDDPVLGRNKWQTFLTEELPPILDKALNATGANAIAGISMSGTSVFNLAIAKPKLYRSVAAYSGCARTSDPLGQAYIRTVIGDRGRGDITNMWGPTDGPGWRENDPYLHASALKGVKVYMTSGTGLPGRYDTLDAPLIDGNPAVLLDQVVMGGLIEAAVRGCTTQMEQALKTAGVDTTIVSRPLGTHSWEYWEQDLQTTWPMIAKDLGTK